MAVAEPWICFHAPWTSRARSGLVVLAQIRDFLAAAATDVTLSWVVLTVWDHGEPDARTADAAARFGGATRRERGPTVACSVWDLRDPSLDVDRFVDFYRDHEAAPPVEDHRAVQLMVSWQFQVRRPGTDDALVPTARFSSDVMVWVDSRHVNLSVRYDTPDYTPALRAAHADVVAALGPRTPRHALQQIIPARTTGGRERRIDIA